jgi:HD superfamily phosphohydrolase YqeK
MTRLETILYLADGLEPGRAFTEREAYEGLAFSDLQAAMKAVLRSTLAYLLGRGLEPAPAMLAAIAYYDSVERTPLSA